MKDCFYWAALHAASDLGPRSLLHLYRYYRSGQEALLASASGLQQVPRLSPQAIERILFFQKYADPVKTYEDLAASGVGVVMLGDPEYPQGLAEIADPPAMLYVKGKLPAPALPLLAVVGARQATPYGMAMARELAQGLAEHGWGVVSGMARGVDTAAHAGALAGNGYTLAVFGCGVNVCYPRENERLRDRIQTQGGLVSEFPPSASPIARNFPIRNRIISGCSLGVLVVEAGIKSGALITAYMALEQSRDVFAVPGSVTSDRSRGTNGLIKQGAKLVETIEDVLVEYPYLQTVKQGRRDAQEKPPEKLSGDEGVVLRKLSLDPVHIDQLAESTGLTVSIVGGLLTMLEIKGLARRLPGHYFISEGPVA
ncbi:MAG: DNA-processing protein DprA [Thermacetogeniaceae bacterium]